MNRGNLTSFDVRPVVGLILALVLVFGWAAVASAQTSNDGQYGNPTASGEQAIANSGSGGSGSGGSGSGGSGDVGSAGTSGGSGGGGSDPSGSGPGVLASVLPETGGPLVVFVGLGAIALGSTGVLMLRLRSIRG